MLTRAPRLLDLFCCQGGAATGYADAGWEVVGVDIDPQPRYPHEFHQGDALEYLEQHGHEFDAVHASPPCQKYTNFARGLELRDGRADLLLPVLDALRPRPVPWIVENVPTAPFPRWAYRISLCGSSFGLRVRRHRVFASNMLIYGPECDHVAQGTPVGVYGNGGAKNPGGSGRRYTDRADALDAMGGRTPWMTTKGLVESIPPAYTQFIGEQLLTTCTEDRDALIHDGMEVRA